MRNSFLKLAVLSAWIIPAQTMAAGFVALPSSGGSAYVQCQTGNYPCAAPNAVNAVLVLNNSPETGFTLRTANTMSVTAFGETLATLNERVFQNAATNECIYAKQLSLSNAATHDYNPYLVGNNRIEVNDFAFGGYTGTISAAYAKGLSSYASAIRIGRTFTSVQRQVDSSGNLCSGFQQLPIAGGVPGTEINGAGPATPCTLTPSAAQQEAPFSANWVDFTSYASASISPDGIGYLSSSPNMYIKQACTNFTTSVVANSMKLRQTGRYIQPWVTVTSSSRAPSTNIAP